MSGPASTGGIGFSGLLTIVFIVLKLTRYIDWSWFWVVSPILISFTALLVFIMITLVLVTYFDKR